jgi:hypothetical protein
VDTLFNVVVHVVEGGGILRVQVGCYGGRHIGWCPSGYVWSNSTPLCQLSWFG